ncbi:MAG: hypothetical protein LUP00_00120, partial [Methanothrix sp.]|nr:hypothetical protein [Methanothrix sp.]
ADFIWLYFKWNPLQGLGLHQEKDFADEGPVPKRARIQPGNPPARVADDECDPRLAAFFRSRH